MEPEKRARSSLGVARASRPTIELGKRIDANVEPPPLTRAEARDGERFPTEKLTRALIREGWSENKRRALVMKSTGDDGTMVNPMALRETLLRLANSETLREIRRRVNETAKEKRRTPEIGARDRSEYGRGMTEADCKPWSAPELVHASADDVEAFFKDLASEVELSELEQFVPHGVRKRKLIENLHAYRVSSHRGVWMVKIVYLAQYKRDVDACRNAWTEDILGHALDSLRDALLTPKSAEDQETELKCVFGLLNHSIQEDLVDTAKIFDEVLRFVHERSLAASKSCSGTAALVLARSMAATLTALVPHASQSHEDSIKLAQKVAVCLEGAVSNGSARADGHLVTRLSEVIASLGSVNADAFISAPREQGLDVVQKLRTKSKRRQMPLSHRLCQVIDDVEKRVQSLTHAASPAVIAIKVHNLVKLLNEVLDKSGDEAMMSELSQKFINAQDDGEVARKAMVNVACSWAVDASDDAVNERQRVTRVFLNELTQSPRPLILHWIKENSANLRQEDDKIGRISGLLIQLLQGDVIRMQQLLDFIIAEGILEERISHDLSMAFHRYLSDIVKDDNAKREILDDSTAQTARQLIGSESEKENTKVVVIPATNVLDFSSDEERLLCTSFADVSYANLASKVAELKSALNASAISHKTLGRVLTVCLMHDATKLGLFAEIVGDMGPEVTKDVLSYVSMDVLSVENLEDTNSIFNCAHWRMCAAFDRWKFARSLVDFQLCLLHNVPKGKRAVAEGLVEANTTQLVQLAKSTNIAHKCLHIWTRILVVIPLIGYVLMSASASNKFSQLILDVLDSIIGKTVVEESAEDIIAESDMGETLVDRLVALFSVVSVGQIPKWAPVVPKLPFRELSSVKLALSKSIESKSIAGMVCVRLQRAISLPLTKLRTRSVNPWKILASGASSDRSKLSDAEKAEFWLQGTVRRPGGNLAWQNCNAEPTFITENKILS